MDVNNNLKDLNWTSNLIIFLSSLGIFISPLIVDESIGAKGFELPKVFFWQFICILIIGIGFFNYINKSINNPSLRLNKDFSIYLSVILISLISSLTSPYQDITWIGNEFRFQGFITHLLLFSLCYIVYKTINKINFHFIAITFIISSIIQGFFGLSQFITIIIPHPELYKEGLWVNGTFGQTNWFTGRLLIGIVFIFFYLFKGMGNKIKLDSEITKKYITLRERILIFIRSTELVRFILLIPLLTSTIIFLILIIVSARSIWAMIIIPFILVFVLSYELIRLITVILTQISDKSTKQIATFLYPNLVRLIILSSVLGGLYLISINTEYNIRFDFWYKITTIFFKQSIDLRQIKIILFGFGFDTLGEVFKTYGYFLGGYVDRAHSVIFDILSQTGTLMFIPITFIFGYINIKMGKAFKDRRFTYLFTALVIWIFRSVVHESGIVNLADIIIILGACIGMIREVNTKNETKLDII